MKEKNRLNRKVLYCANKVEAPIPADFTIAEALNYLRHRRIHDRIAYFYVLDHKERLVGVVGTRALILHDPETPIKEVMQTKVICLHKEQTLHEALEILQSHRFLSLPVVDENRVLLGVVDIDLYLEESMDVASSKRRFELFQLIGIYVEEGKTPSVLGRYSRRMPWIFCNMFGGILCAIISHFYELVLSKALLLAMFIPLVLTLSESISMQSMTQSMQLLHTAKSHKRIFFEKFIKELLTVFLIAVSSGVLVGGLSLLWGDGYLPGLAIGFGIMISVTVTASIGFIVPLILHLRSWDPKVAGGPVVLMFADVLTTAIYLSLATLLIIS